MSFPGIYYPAKDPLVLRINPSLIYHENYSRTQDRTYYLEPRWGVPENPDYEIIIDWGDGTSYRGPWKFSGQLRHTYQVGVTEAIVRIWGEYRPANLTDDARDGVIVASPGLIEVIDWGEFHFGGILLGRGTIYPEVESTNLIKVPDYLPSYIHNCYYMLSGLEHNLPEIANWDVSRVTTFRGMFAQNKGINLDLSHWCVEHIPQEPPFFAIGTSANWTLPKPNWGAPC